MSEPLTRGAPVPPEGQVRWWRIISPGQARPMVVALTGDTFFGQWTHYVPPTLPCSRTPDCVWCKGGSGSRFSGYIACVQRLDKKEYVLALTFGACKQLLPILAERGTLRGLEIELARKHDAPNAPVVVKVLSQLNAAKLPQPFDVEDSLSRMWGVNREFLSRGCRRLDDTSPRGLTEGNVRVAAFLRSYEEHHFPRTGE